jgi:hypothetical protein
MLAGAILVGGMWAWHAASDLALDWDVGRPELIVWAIRSSAIAGEAAAQVILLAAVGGPMRTPRSFDAIIMLAAVAVFTIASVGAVACGLAGQ